MITMTPETKKQMLTETMEWRFATVAARRQVQSWGRRPDILGRTANRLQGDIVVTRSSPPPPPSPWWWWWWLQTGIRAKPPWGSPPRTWLGEGACCRERVHIPCILIISGTSHYKSHKSFTFCQLSMYKFSWINCKQKQIWRTNWLFKTNSITKQSKAGAIISKFQRWIDLDQVSFSYASVKLPFYDLFDANSEILYPITILFYNSVMLKLE